MKYLAISRLAPGVDNVTQAFETFGNTGTAEGTQALYASVDGKTFVALIENDEPDMVSSATYAPFMESVTVIPIVDMDDKWLAAMTTAVERFGD